MPDPLDPLEAARRLKSGGGAATLDPVAAARKMKAPASTGAQPRALASTDPNSLAAQMLGTDPATVAGRESYNARLAATPPEKQGILDSTLGNILGPIKGRLDEVGHQMLGAGGRIIGKFNPEGVHDLLSSLLPTDQTGAFDFDKTASGRIAARALAQSQGRPFHESPSRESTLGDIPADALQIAGGAFAPVMEGVGLVAPDPRDPNAYSNPVTRALGQTLRLPLDAPVQLGEAALEIPGAREAATSLLGQRGPEVFQGGVTLATGGPIMHGLGRAFGGPVPEMPRGPILDATEFERRGQPAAPTGPLDLTPSQPLSRVVSPQEAARIVRERMASKDPRVKVVGPGRAARAAAKPEAPAAAEPAAPKFAAGEKIERATLLPKPGEGTVPTVEEQQIAAAGGPAKVAAETGRQVVSQPDGQSALVPPAQVPEAQALAAKGTLPELVNGAGNATKPAAPTEIVTGKDAAGIEVRSVLTPTPEQTAAASAKQAEQGLDVEVKPATEANLQQTLAERQAQPLADPNSNAGQLSMRAKPGEVFDPETLFNEVDSRGTGGDAQARVTPLPNGRFRAEFREGFDVEAEPWAKIAETGSFDEGIAAIESHTRNKNREPATIDVEGTVREEPKALPSPLAAEAADRRVQSAAQPDRTARQSNAVADALDRVAKGEDPATVAAELERSMPERADPSADIADNPSTMGQNARHAFEAALKVQEGAAKPATPAGPTALSDVNGPETTGKQPQPTQSRMPAESPREPWQMRRSDFLKEADLKAGEKAVYFDPSGKKIASSREAPSTAEQPPLGSWRIGTDSTWNKYGDTIEQLREIPVEKVKGSEDSFGREGDIERYAQWIREGKLPPPIRAAAMPDGTFKIMDGHRRLLAHGKAGKATIRAWVAPEGKTGKLDSFGKDWGTDLTHQMAVKQAIAEGKAVPPEVLADYPDLSNSAAGGEPHITAQQRTTEPVDAPSRTSAHDVAPGPPAPVVADVAPASPPDTSGTSTAKPERFAAGEKVTKRPRASGEPGSEGTWSVADIEVDPKAMQFKKSANEATGETGALRDIQKPGDWDVAREGVVTLWRDPETGRVLAEDGHQRVPAARRAGRAEILVRFSKAKTIEEARIEGALINAGGGSLTIADAGRLFRELGDMGLKGDALKAWLKEKRVVMNAPSRAGRALSTLSDELWGKYLDGTLDEAKAVAIGETGATPQQQARLAKSAATPREIPALAQRITEAAETTKTTGDLFGSETATDTLYEVEAKLETELLKGLAKEKRAYRSAAENQKTLENVGKIDAEAAAAKADDTGTLADVAREELKFRGPLRDAISAAARDVNSGALTTTDAVRRLRSESTEILSKQHPELREALEKAAAVAEAPAERTLFSTGDRIGRREKPIAQTAEEVREKPKAPPREGPTLGSGRLFTARMAKQAEGLLDRVDHAVAEGVTKSAVEGFKEEFPRVAEAGKKLYDKVLSSPERAISPEFESAVMEGRKVKTGMSHEADIAVRAFREATKGLDEATVDAIGKSLNSEAADLAKLSPEVRRGVEETRATIQRFRAKEVGESGTLSPEAFEEYPEGHLTRIPKPGIVPSMRRVGARVGNLGVGPYKLAKDMHTIELKLTPEEARALVPEGAPLRYLKEHGDKTLLQFTDSPEGLRARDQFIDNVAEKFGEARSKLTADSTREIEAGDVQQAKMLMKAQLDTPRMKDLGVKVTDPIPADVAKKVFVSDPTARLHRTLHESADRLGRAETLKRISKVVDANGPVVIEPKDAGRAARGIESPPEGYEFMSSKNLGELQGKFVRSDAAEYVRGAFAPEARGFWNGLSSGLMERFKVARLLYNPRQWVRQLPSNMEFENLMGFSNWNPRYLQHKLRGLKAMRESSPYYKDLVAERLHESSFVTPEELGLMSEALEGPGSVGHRIGRALGTFGVSEVAPKALGKVDAALGRMYGKADAWTKASGYVYAIEELGMSPKDAANYVRKWTPSPESVSKAIQSYSRHIIGDPWARYRAEQLRINGHALVEKPVRLTMNLYQKNLIRGAAVVTGASLLSKDEEESLENEQGEGAIAVGRNDAGDPLALDYSFLSTIGDIFDTPSEIGKSGEHAVERGLQLTGVGDNPLLSILGEQVTRHDKWGREINPEGTGMGAAKALGRSILKQWLPSLATNHREKLAAAWKGEPYSPNQPIQTKPQAILDVFFGFKLSPLEAERALEKIQRQGARAMNDIERDFENRELRGEDVDFDRAVELADALMAEYDERAAPLERIDASRKLDASTKITAPKKEPAPAGR